eukprot:9281835-Prorocentrum_lima.AAC.1
MATLKCSVAASLPTSTLPSFLRRQKNCRCVLTLVKKPLGNALKGDLPRTMLLMKSAAALQL